MANDLSLSSIINGAQLAVAVGTSGGETVYAFATSCSVNITTNTSEVATKEFGQYPGKIIQSLDWEITTENLYGGGNFNAVYTALQAQMASKNPVHVIFGQISSSDWHDGKGVVTANQSTGNYTIGSFGSLTGVVSGYAFITSLSANAAVGDNATMSATFSGFGPLDQMSNGGGE